MKVFIASAFAFMQGHYSPVSLADFQNPRLHGRNLLHAIPFAVAVCRFVQATAGTG